MLGATEYDIISTQIIFQSVHTIEICKEGIVHGAQGE
jgi:hypothetical protein